MAKILISPSKYLQGAGEMKKIGTYASNCGKKALVLISKGGYKRIGKMIEDSFAESTCEVVFDYFNGECCNSEIDRLVNIVKENQCDLVIGIGGGKIFDTAKAVAYYAGTPVFICPTIASTDAPCSALSVVYTEEGIFEKYLFLPANPNLVLMDTDIITKSPVRLTVAGMGDALATYFEARACKRSGATSCAGGKTTEAAMALAKLCFDTLMEEGVKAKIALEAGVCTPAVEKVIEANTLLSGSDLKVPDLREHMRSTMDLQYWKNATICIMEKKLHLEHLLSWYWKTFRKKNWKISFCGASKSDCLLPWQNLVPAM